MENCGENYFIISIIAMIKAHGGKLFYIPIFGRIAYNKYFGPNAIKIEIENMNTPPGGIK